MPNLRARFLRNNMTRHEVKLWSQLKHFNARGYHFRRQAPIAGYIVDFVEKTQRLVIEVDGSQHSTDEGLAYDQHRDARLASLGYRVMRVWNSDIDSNLSGVIDSITLALTPPAAQCAAPSPLREEG